MWHMAGVAGTGVAIAGVGATYYALSRRDYELESRNRSLLDAQTVAGYSKHPNWDDAEAGILERTYSSLFGMSPPGEKGGGLPHMTASQNFLKANFEALARGSGSVDGLNVAQTEIAPEEGFGALRVHRIVSRAETDSSVLDADNNARQHPNGSRSDTTGYLRRRDNVISIPSGSEINIIQPVASPILTTEKLSPTSLKSDSSRSVFDVETCSTYQLYSEEDITASTSAAKLPALSTLQGSRDSQPNFMQQAKPPTLSNRVQQRSMIPIMIKSKASVAKHPLRKSLPNTIGAKSPYLTRAEPVNFPCKLKQSKLIKSSSTAQDFPNRGQKCEHFQTARSCDTSLGRFTLGKHQTMSASPQSTVPVTNLAPAAEVMAENVLVDFVKSQVEERNSVEVLFPHNNPDSSQQSVTEKECDHDQGVEAGNDDEDVELPLEPQPVNQKDVDNFIKILEHMETNSNEQLKSSSGTDISDYKNDVYNPNPGIMGGIPRDSWVMLPLRYIPGEMIPWSIVCFTPILVFMMGISGYIFVSLTQYLFLDFEEIANITSILPK